MRPNILFILADQLRPDFLGYEGCEAIETPHIDKLAAESVNYRKAISACPICVPARAALLTGLSSLRTGVIGNAYWLRPDRAEAGIRTWPELLGGAGYYTAAIGKMHFTPWESPEGFEKRVIAEDKRWPLIGDDYQDFLAARGAGKRFAMEDPEYGPKYGAVVNPLPTELTVDRFVTGAAIEALRGRPADRPFAFMVGYPSPHCPYDPPREYLEKVDASMLPEPIEDDWNGEGKQGVYQAALRGLKEPWHQIDYSHFPREAKMAIRRHYAALVKQVDDEVGTLTGELERQGLLDNTVIVFASDHGDFVGDRGLVGKKLFYENSVRVPLLVRLPGGMGAHESRELVELGDITATLLSLSGVEVPAMMSSRPLPGLGIPATPREHVTGFLQDQAMVRWKQWKLTRYRAGLVELFDVESDPREQQNRYHDPACAGVVRVMEEMLWQELFEATAFASGTLAYECKPGRYLDEDFCRKGWRRTYPALVS